MRKPGSPGCCERPFGTAGSRSPIPIADPATPRIVRLKSKDREYVAAREAQRSHLGGEAATLRRRYEHRVEREQKAHHRADRGEQPGRLIAWLGGLLQQLRLVVGGRHVQASAGDLLELFAHYSVCAGSRSYEDRADPISHAADVLDRGQQPDRDRAPRHRADRLRSERRSQLHRTGAAAREDRDWVSRSRADPTGYFFRQPDSSRQQLSAGAEIAGRFAFQCDDRRGEADQLDRFAALWSHDGRRLAQDRRGDLHVRKFSDRRR